MIYIIVLFLMLVCVYVYDVRRHTLFYSFCFWGFFIVLVAIAALRYRIGTDSIVYERVYEYMPKLWELHKFKFGNTRFEPGFIIFSSIPRSFSSDFTLFQFFHAFVVNLVIFWFIKNNTNHRFLLLTFYFIMLFLNLNTQVLREALAVCLFLLAWPFFRDGKWLYYYAIVILATFFHVSAFLLLLFPLCCAPGIRQLFVIGKRTILICLIMLGVGYLILSKFQQFFLALAVTDRMIDRVGAYENSNFLDVLSLTGCIYVFVKLALFPMVATFFIYGKRKKKGIFSSKPAKMEVLVIINIYITMLSMFMLIFNRYNNYLGLFSMAVVANWAFSLVRANRKKIRLRPVYWFIILLPYLGLNINEYNAKAGRTSNLRTYMIYYPYYTRLDPKLDQNREMMYRNYGI